jgi:hypothetical protein
MAAAACGVGTSKEMVLQTRMIVQYCSAIRNTVHCLDMEHFTQEITNSSYFCLHLANAEFKAETGEVSTIEQIESRRKYQLQFSAFKKRSGTAMIAKTRTRRWRSFGAE